MCIRDRYKYEKVIIGARFRFTVFLHQALNSITHISTNVISPIAMPVKSNLRIHTVIGNATERKERMRFWIPSGKNNFSHAFVYLRTPTFWITTANVYSIYVSITKFSLEVDFSPHLVPNVQNAQIIQNRFWFNISSRDPPWLKPCTCRCNVFLITGKVLDTHIKLLK